jgi:LPS-assembly protein
VHASGDVEIVSADGSVTYADEVEADQALNLGVATELRARFGKNGTLAARSVLRRGVGQNELNNVIYTSCPICEAGHRPPTWSLRARRAIENQTNRTISYHDAVFEVAGVPILYLPWFLHPDPTAGRASGFLPPGIGRNRKLGTFYDQPYYWAISPYQDLTASARVHSHVHPLYGLDYRQRFFSGDLEIEGTVTNEQEFTGSGNTFGDESVRSSLFAKGQFRINDFWRWGFGAERISDDLYLKRYSLRGAGEVRGPYVGDDTRLISQLYATGQNEDDYAQLAFVSFQGLRANDSADLMPLILPFAQFDHVIHDPLFNGQLHLEGNTAVLERSVGLDTARATLEANWRTDAIFGPGLVFSPFAQARGDVFHDETSANHYETFSRAVGMAGAEVSWPFLRAGENLDVIVEPVVMAAFATDPGVDSRIVNEDGLGFELDDSNLFRPNSVPNYDLWEPGGRVSAGMRATARAATGQSASFMFGRQWRSESDPQLAPRTNLSGRLSDWVGSFETDLGNNFASSVRFQLDDETLDLQRIDANVRGTLGRFNASVRYYNINDVLAPGNPSSEITYGVGTELTGGWRVQADVTRDLDSDINLTQDIRAIYEDDCTFLEIVYTRSETLDRTLGPDEGLQIRVGLRSLGVVGGN